MAVADMLVIIPILFKQVPLGVLPEDETSYEGMIRILEALQKYVPTKVTDIKEKIPGTDLQKEKTFITTLVGGDYLSVARARGAILIRSNSELQEDRLNGVWPVAEDWHAKVCLIEVSVTFDNQHAPHVHCWDLRFINLAQSPYCHKQTSLIKFCIASPAPPPPSPPPLALMPPVTIRREGPAGACG